MFKGNIRAELLKKANELVEEARNLPERMRDVLAVLAAADAPLTILETARRLGHDIRGSGGAQGAWSGRFKELSQREWVQTDTGRRGYKHRVPQKVAECWRVLRPGGILALVLKGFTRDGKYVDLPGQTETLLLAASWMKYDEWRREIWSLSFWRILQQQRDPEAFDDRLKYEMVLAFKKPEGPGNGVAAIITSSPYQIEAPGLPSGTGAGAFKGEHGHGYTHLVSLIVTSPPYEEGLGHGSGTNRERNIARSRNIHDGHLAYTRPHGAPDV